MWKLSAFRGFSGVNYFPHLEWIWRFTEHVSVLTQNVVKCWQDQHQMRVLFTQLTSEHCFVILIPFYCKLTVIGWVNNSEDMKPLAPTPVVLPEYDPFTSIYWALFNDLSNLSIYLSIYLIYLSIYPMTWKTASSPFLSIE